MKKEEARHLDGVVGDLLRKWQTRKVERASAVRDAWGEAANQQAKEHTQLVSYKNSILVVVVENSSLLYKLTLEKREMLKRFNACYKGRKKAKDIRFRIGILDA